MPRCLTRVQRPKTGLKLPVLGLDRRRRVGSRALQFHDELTLMAQRGPLDSREYNDGEYVHEYVFPLEV